MVGTPTDRVNAVWECVMELVGRPSPLSPLSHCKYLHFGPTLSFCVVTRKRSKMSAMV